MYDVTVVGCGVVGASVAYELSKYQMSVAILEKENDIACGTTRANSAIVHAGYDPKPGTRMARLNVAGSKMMEDLCSQLGVAYKRIGSFVIAFSAEDMDLLHELLRRGNANGVEGLRILTKDEALEMDPKLNPDIFGALYAPTAAVVDPWGLAIALTQSSVQNGVDLFLNAQVTDIKKMGDHYQVKTIGKTVETKYIVNAAGTHSDQVNNLVAKPFFEIQPVRGEYYLMDKSQGELVQHTIFQTPNKDGKGVLVSPTVHGNLIVGPTADSTKDPDDTSVTEKGLEKVAKTSVRSVAQINFRESIRNFAGVRATTKYEDDFIIEESKDAPQFINVAAIKSPGLSAAPAIGIEVREILQGIGLKCDKKNTPLTKFHKRILFKNMTDAERAEALQRDPHYGRVVCRCETITEGDILQVLHDPIPPVSIDGVKRRCNTGMGRCQGGFCGPRVHEILSRELGIPMEEILQDRTGSYLLTGQTKEGSVEK